MVDKSFECISLEHGSGGLLSRELVETVIYPAFRSGHYAELSDASKFDLQGTAFLTADSFVVDPPFFAGGDIGRLSVFGTCNDLSVSGAEPRFLSFSLVLEAGFPLSDLRRILASAAEASQEAGVHIITGDTKVVPEGKGGGIYVHTSGVGEKVFQGTLSPTNIREKDCILVSGPIGSHGIAVLAARENLEAGKNIRTDCAFLHPLCASLFELGNDLRFIRDATRGGVAAVLNELVAGTNYGIDVEEEAFPVDNTVSKVAEVLGLNLFEIANEGVLIAVVSEATGEKARELLSLCTSGKHASIVGTVTKEHKGKVVARTCIGGRRIMGFPRGLLVPRIC